ncbi:MAG TPA: metallopeptidase TldD-related protein [Terriglobales bacterium]|nr:metallopeptidase TldD-related protein [Terriglobales bacterium]
MSGRLDLEIARRLLAETRRAAGSAAVEITVEGGRSELTRFANNAIHQHVGESAMTLSVRTQLGKRTARASTHRVDSEGVQAVTARALELTGAQAEDPDLLPMAEPSAAAAPPPVSRWDDRTAAITPAERAAAVAEMVGVAKLGGFTAAGTCATQSGAVALLNSNGVEAFYPSTGAEFSVTMLATDSSGWAKGSAVRWVDIASKAGAAIAAEKARASANPVAVPAGKYTVILEPPAVLDLLGFLMWDFGGQAVLDQRSFLSDRVGTKLFGENITIWDDAYHPLQTGMPCDGEGVPRQRIPLVERGTVRNLVYARQTAEQWNRQRPQSASPTGHGFPLPNEYGEAPLNVVMAGGNASIEEMIASTERGILVTRLWYIREVEPYSKMLTGMTRDGTFLIESGKLRSGVRNFRFNQSMVEMLNQVEALGPAVRASGEESFDMVVPPLKVREFNFTEVTRF